jgi:hypothetical protein
MIAAYGHVRAVLSPPSFFCYRSPSRGDALNEVVSLVVGVVVFFVLALVVMGMAREWKYRYAVPVKLAACGAVSAIVSITLYLLLER